MSSFELFNANGDTGMLVIGTGVDVTFRKQADEVGRTDERLITVESVDALLNEDALKLAAVGLAANMPPVPKKQEAA